MSENIKEALEYAVELAGQEDFIIYDEAGNEWYDENKHHLKKLSPKKYPSTLNLSTLSSLIDYYKNDVNKINSQKTIVVVDNPKEVYVYSEDDEEAYRTKLITVEALVPNIDFGKFLNTENFIITLQSKFINDADRELLLEYASKIVIENGAEIEDTGSSQITTIKTGVANKGKAKTPNPVTLKPYRTFSEVDQPTSDFVFRVDKDGKLAIFEADGGAWRLKAVDYIKAYLTEKLDVVENVTVLA